MNPATNQPSILTLRLGQSDQAGQLRLRRATPPVMAFFFRRAVRWGKDSRAVNRWAWSSTIAMAPSRTSQALRGTHSKLAPI